MSTTDPKIIPMSTFKTLVDMHIDIIYHIHILKFALLIFLRDTIFVPQLCKYQSRKIIHSLCMKVCRFFEV